MKSNKSNQNNFVCGVPLCIQRILNPLFHSILKNSIVNLIEKVLAPHFTCEETEAQGDWIVFPQLTHEVLY